MIGLVDVARWARRSYLQALPLREIPPALHRRA
jgi:hypothetical protein